MTAPALETVHIGKGWFPEESGGLDRYYYDLARHLQEAGVGVRYGNMAVNDALKMITLNPAIQLGVDKMVGTLEVGKDGDIAVFSSHPFSPTAMVEYTIIDGKVYFDRNDATTLRKTAAGAGGDR